MNNTGSQTGQFPEIDPTIWCEKERGLDLSIFIAAEILDL
jgi:hypothetical protein